MNYFAGKDNHILDLPNKNLTQKRNSKKLI